MGNGQHFIQSVLPRPTSPHPLRHLLLARQVDAHALSGRDLLVGWPMAAGRRRTAVITKIIIHAPPPGQNGRAQVAQRLQHLRAPFRRLAL